jgi:hypothetical protein
MALHAPLDAGGTPWSWPPKTRREQEQREAQERARRERLAKEREQLRRQQEQWKLEQERELMRKHEVTAIAAVATAALSPRRCRWSLGRWKRRCVGRSE